MSGASEQTRRVMVVNANWNHGSSGDDGTFELMLVTEDNQQHILAPSPAAMTTLVALTQADTVLLFDPTNRTLIVGNLRGSWLPRN